ncbi:cop9 signalosome-interactor 1 [Monosporozyma servazzii]
MPIIDLVALWEVNYNYELEHVKSLETYYSKNANGLFQIYLLMGVEQNDEIRLVKSIHIPKGNNLNDIESINRKVELLHVVNQGEMGFKPLSLLVVNPNLNDDQTLFEKLREMYQIQLKFEYEPCTINNNICMDTELRLKCYYWDQRWFQTDFKVKDEPIDVMDLQNSGSPTNKTYNQLEENANSVHSINYESFNAESMKQEELINRIIKRIDYMTDYLNHCPTPKEDILIKISLLIKRLQKSSTSDIDTELMSIENEIKMLQITCNQWEIIN